MCGRGRVSTDAKSPFEKVEGEGSIYTAMTQSFWMKPGVKMS